jgi:hypothetical protein
MSLPLSVRSRPLLLFTFFLLVLSVAYFKVMRGEFLYDDVELVLGNKQLAAVDSLIGVASYSLKPSRPVSDFFMALGEWFTPRRSFGQRAISIVAHALAGFFLLLNLLLLCRKFDKRLPPFLCFMTAFIFVVSPIQSEAILITQFRMEILGGLFSLIALWAFQQRFYDEEERGVFWKVLLFLSLGAAALSKEPYVFIAPALIVFTSFFYGRARRTAVEILILQCFWGWILYTRLQLEPSSVRPYRDLLGYSIITPQQHFILAAHALIEGIGKVFSGHHLTIVPLRERLDFVRASGTIKNTLPLVFFLAFLIGLARKSGWPRFAAGFLAISSLLYLIIPNINIGSEHYWYLGVAAVWFTFLSIVWVMHNYSMDHPIRGFAVFSIILAGLLIINLERRVKHMGTRMDFYYVELKAHPQIASRWVDMAATFMDSPKMDVVELANNFLAQARELDPNNPLLVSNEYFYAVIMKDRQSAFKKYQDLMQIYHDQPIKKADFSRFWKSNLGDLPTQKPQNVF